MNQSRR